MRYCPHQYSSQFILATWIDKKGRQWEKYKEMCGICGKGGTLFARKRRVH